MKIETPNHQVELNGTIKNREFTVKTGAHIMSVLSNLYTHPEDAMVREYSTNMLDAYIALGGDSAKWQPPILSLPTKLEPVLMFKDFGIGMSEDMVWEVYTQYGNSTKNDSNAQVGGFGLGSKVAFCYNSGSAWSIESRYDGKLHTFMAYINKEGIPSLTHVSTVPTTEHSGMTIRIPIAHKDISAVVAAGEKYARYFPLPLVVVGATPNYNQVQPYLIEGTNWGIHTANDNDSHVLNVVMGNVPYPITRADVYPYQYSSERAKMPHEKISTLLNTLSFDLMVKVGDVDIVPSRDTLQYTEKTRKAIDAAFNVMMTELPKQIESRTQSAPNAYTALEIVLKLIGVLHQAFPDLAGKLVDLKWKGESINANKGLSRTAAQLSAWDARASMKVFTNIEPDKLKDATYPIGNPGYYSTALGEISEMDTPALVGRAHQYVIINDMVKHVERTAKSFLFDKVMKKTLSGRKARYGHKEGMVTLITTTKTPQELADFFGGMPVQNIQLLSAVAKTVTIPQALKGTVDSVYKWSGSSWAARVNRPTTTDKYYLPLSQEGAGGRWVYILTGRRYDSQRSQVTEIIEVLRTLQTMPCNESDIYGVKPDDIDGLDTSWVNLETLAWDGATKMLSASPEKMAALKANHGMLTEITVQYMNLLARRFGADMKGDVAGFLSMYDRMETLFRTEAQTFYTVYNFVKKFDTHPSRSAEVQRLMTLIDNIKAEDLQATAETLAKPYPMLAMLFGSDYGYARKNVDEVLHSKSGAKILHDYIKSIT